MLLNVISTWKREAAVIIARAVSLACSVEAGSYHYPKRKNWFWGLLELHADCLRWYTPSVSVRTRPPGGIHMSTEGTGDIVEVLDRFKAALLRIPSELAEADNADRGRGKNGMTGQALLAKGETFRKRDPECFPEDPYSDRPRVMSPKDVESIICDVEAICGPGALAQAYREEVGVAFGVYRTEFPKACPVADPKPDDAASKVESLLPDGARLKDLNDLTVLGAFLNEHVYVNGVAKGKRGGGLSVARSMRVVLQGGGHEKGSRNRWLGIKRSHLADHDGLACTFGHWASHRAKNNAEKKRFQRGLEEARSQQSEFKPFYEFRICNQNGHDGDVEGYWECLRIGHRAWHPGYGVGRKDTKPEEPSPGVGNLIDHLTFETGLRLDVRMSEIGDKPLGVLWREVIEWEKANDLLFAGMRIAPFARALAREGKFEEAFKLADEMDDARRAAEVMYAKDGEVDPLLVMEGRSCVLRSDLHAALAGETSDPGNRSAAVDQVFRAKSISEMIDNIELSEMVSKRIGRTENK